LTNDALWPLEALDPALEVGVITAVAAA
jgi:hypothetical protein